MKPTIIYEDAQIIVCEKKAGVPSQGDRSMVPDMVSLLKTYLYEKNGKSDPYVAVVHRLDRGVGGVMVYAKTKQAAAALSEQIRSNQVHKKYYAVVNGAVAISDEWKTLKNYLKKDAAKNTSVVVNAGEKDAKEAVLSYRALEQHQEDEELWTLLDIDLQTGRHHQIRVQMAENLGGIVGDTKYNPMYQGRRGWSKIGLYSYSITFCHPKTKKEMEFFMTPKELPFSRFGCLAED